MKILVPPAFVLVFCSVLVSCQTSDKNKCTSAISCGACISLGDACVWCKDQETSLKFRCNDRKNLVDSCSTIVEVMNSYTPGQSVELKDPDPANGVEAVQLQPQTVRIEAKPNAPVTFDATFRLASNYPVDLYYLMDLSFSMCDDKTTLATMALDIAKKMRALTGDFRLGFGSFVDKVAMPYVNMHPLKYQNPCPVKREAQMNCTCVPPYDFRHTLALMGDEQEFSKQVSIGLVGRY